jgi:hypothetical protein
MGRSIRTLETSLQAGEKGTRPVSGERVVN